MALSVPNITEILKNLNDQMPALFRLVTALTYFIGMAFGIKALFLFKVYGDTRAGSGQADLKKPALYMLVSAVLLYWPSILTATLQTIYAKSTITPYSYTGGDEKIANFIQLAGNIIKWIGYVAFLRGWMLIVRVGDQNAQGMLGRAIVHIFAGVMAINIFETWAILRSLFGL